MTIHCGEANRASLNSAEIALREVYQIVDICPYPIIGRAGSRTVLRDTPHLPVGFKKNTLRRELPMEVAEAWRFVARWVGVDLERVDRVPR